SLMDSAPEAWEFQFRAVRQEFGIDSIDGRQRILNEMLRLLALVPELPGTLRESLMIANLAQRLMVPEETVRVHLQKARTTQPQRSHPIPDAVSTPQVSHEMGRILRHQLSRD